MKIPLNSAVETREDAERVATQLATYINAQKILVAKRDEEILGINKCYEGNLSDLGAKIAALTDSLCGWAQTNPAEFPQDRKSIKMTSGILGFRTGTPKLVLASRAWTWEKVLAALKSVATMKIFIRFKEEVDKEQILGMNSAAEDKAQWAAQLKTCGMVVKQEESFFFEPALTEVETRQTI
jgi:phage host-nuclease inhibitor protein Gam